jgi:hypothetical protein
MKTTDLRYDYRALLALCTHFDAELEQLETFTKLLAVHVFAYYGYLSHCRFKKIEPDLELDYFIDWIGLEDGRVVKVFEIFGKDMARVISGEETKKKSNPKQ